MKKHLLLLMLCACIAIGHAQPFRNLSQRDGLSGAIAWAIFKDSSGFAWIGTSNAVDRFDGCHFRSYPLPENGNVTALAEMPGKGMFVGTTQGLWRIRPGATAMEQVAPDTIACEINVLLLHEPTGKLLVGGSTGLYILSPGYQLEHVLLETDALSLANNILDIAADSTDNIYIATRGGLYALTMSDRQVRAYAPQTVGFPSTYTKVCLLDSTLYLGTQKDGVIAVDIRTGHFSHYLKVDWPVTALSSDTEQGLLHLGSDGGGIQFIKAEDRSIVRDIRHNTNTAGSLSSNSVYSLLVDREGIIWVGLYQLGVDYSMFQRGLFSTYQMLPDFDLSGVAVRSLEVVEEGILIGSREGLFYADDHRGIRRHYVPPVIRSQMILCSHYHNGLFYIGTYEGGMYVLDPATATLRDFDPAIGDPMLHGSVFSITTDPKGRIWAGTTNGVFCYHPDGRLIKHYNESNSRLPSEYVFCVFFDSMQRGWICTGTDVMLLTEMADGTITFSDKLPAGFISKALVRSVYEDSQHNLYFVPDDGNLFVSDLSLNHFHEITNAQLDGKNLRFVIEDDDHYLWIGTSDGLYRYNGEGHFASYDFTDGLPTSTFLGCIPRRDYMGGLWLGSSQGLIHTTMERINRDWRAGYPLQITGILADNDTIDLPLSEGEHISLGPIDERLSLRLSQFTYTDPDYMAYEYRLDGKDKDWCTVVGASEVTYYRLPPRNYTFRLRHPGQPESEVVLPITVCRAVPLYVSLPLVVLIITAGGVLLYRHRKLRAQADEAARIAEEVAKGSNGEGGTSEEPDTATTEAAPKYRFSKITTEECQALAVQLEALMREEKLYVNPALKISDLGNRLNVPTYKLSYLFNQHLNLSFYDYVNNFRIAEFKELVAQGEHKSYTIDTLMSRCGFVSRTTFFRYFKKVNGQTPNEYIRSQG